MTSNQIVTAQYSINEYTVTFVDWNGSSTQSIEYGSNAYEVTPPVRITFNFIGWYKDIELTQPFDFETEVITQDIYLYAKYQKITQTVVYQDFDGTVLKTEVIDHGSDSTPPSNPSRTGYTFTGWSSSYENIIEDKTLIAQYTINQYTVTFKDWDGSTLSTVTINYNTSATLPSSPSRIGYTFTGWSGTYTNVTSNQIVTAQYTINSYTVTFVDWNGSTISTQNINHGSSATAPSNPSRTGYTFTGWSGIYTNVTSSRTITATYSINEYTVTFIGMDSNVYTTQSVEYGSFAIDVGRPTYMPDFTLTFNFIGWFMDSEKTILFDFETEPVTDYLTLYAKYQKITQTVTFKDWDGTILKTETVDQATSATPPSNPSRTGYTFISWDLSYTNVIEDMIITAVYEINEYAVRYIDWDGSNVATEYIEYGSKAYEILPPVRVTFNFIGWYKDIELTQLFDFETEVITEDIYLYAKYQKITQTVTFKDWDGTILKTETVDQATSATPPSNPSRTGYTFISWDLSYTNVIEDMIITAVYEINEYAVRYIDWDGSNVATEYIEYGSKAYEILPPVRVTFNFIGWYKDIELTQLFDFETEVITEDIYLYAKYQKITHTVNFILFDLVVYETRQIDDGNKISSPENPTRNGFMFDGWFKDVELTQPFDFEVERIYVPTSLFAKWIPISSYLVEFRDYNNNLIKSEFVLVGGSANPPTNLSRIGYSFVGWDKDYTNVNQNLVIKAIYTLNTSSSDGDILSSDSMMIVFVMGGLVGLSILISIFKRKKRGYRR